MKQHTKCLLIYPLSGFLMSLFNKSPDVIDAGCQYLYRILPFYWMLAITFTLNGVLRGAGSAPRRLIPVHDFLEK